MRFAINVKMIPSSIRVVIAISSACFLVPWNADIISSVNMVWCVFSGLNSTILLLYTFYSTNVEIVSISET